ncbi:MAG: autotransporter-associated beta strand repeat-containing protein [Verrucomicrobiota bacterium]
MAASRSSLPKAGWSLLVSSMICTSSFAQMYWDINGRTTGASGGVQAAGTWGTDNFWSTSSGGTVGTSAWIAGQQAVFSAGTNASGVFTVGVSGNQQASGINFQEGTVTLNNGTITLGNGVGRTTISVSNGLTGTINSQLAGNQGMTKTGPGTLVLGGSNTLSGTLDLKQGTLLVSKPTSLGSSTLSLDGGIFGASGGAVTVGNTVTVDSDSTVGGSQNLTFTGPVTATGGPRQLTVANTAQTTFAGNLFLGDRNRRGRFTLNITGGDTTVSGVIQNGLGARPDSLIKTGNGSLILSGANTFSGGLQNLAGSLYLGNDSAAGSGTLTLGDGSTIAAANGSRTINNALSILGNVSFGGLDTLTFNSSFNLGGDRVFTIWNTTIFNGVIGGSGYSLTKRGTGTMVLNGANNFGGAGRRLAVEAGTVGLGNNNAVGASGTALVLNGGSVAAWNAARTIGNTLVISNNSGIVGGLGLTFSGSVSNLGGSHVLSVSNTALTSFAGTTLSLAGNNQASTLTLDVAGTSGGLTISSAIQNGAGTGAGSLVKNGAGNLALNGTAANTFSGGLTVNGGTVTAGKANALGAGAVTVNAATVNVGTYNQSMSTLTMAGGTINGGSVITPTSVQAQSGAINVSVAGTGSLIKSGAGTMTLSGSNSYSGGTTINGGVLNVNNTRGSGTGSGTVTVNSGGRLGGTGSVGGAVVLNGGKIGAGTSGVGSLGTVNETWNPGSSLLVDLQDVASGEGVGWDVVKITGSLAVNGTGNPILVDLSSLTLGGSAGAVYNFNASQSYSWRILSTTAGITFGSGQSLSTALQLSTAHFANNTAGGHFSLALANGNKDLTLSFTPTQVPEPGAWSMVGMGFFLLLVRRKIAGDSSRS